MADGCDPHARGATMGASTYDRPTSRERTNSTLDIVRGCRPRTLMNEEYTPKNSHSMYFTLFFIFSPFFTVQRVEEYLQWQKCRSIKPLFTYILRCTGGDALPRKLSIAGSVLRYCTAGTAGFGKAHFEAYRTEKTKNVPRHRVLARIPNLTTIS